MASLPVLVFTGLEFIKIIILKINKNIIVIYLI